MSCQYSDQCTPGYDCFCEDELPEPLTQWQQYSTEFDTTRYLEWVDYANASGFSVLHWLKALYSRNDKVHEMSTKASPFMARFKGT